MTTAAAGVAVVDLASTSLRELNQRLHDLAGDDTEPRRFQVLTRTGRTQSHVGSTLRWRWRSWGTLATTALG